MGEASETFVDEGKGGPVAVTLRRQGVREIFERMERAERWATSALEEHPPTRFDGNRQARRKAAARSRKGIASEPTTSIHPDVIRATFAAAEAEVTRNRRIAEHMERTREWQAVQALQGRIIDTLPPEERAARDAAASAESDRAEAEYAARRQA